MFRSFEQVVDAALAQEVALALLGRAGLSIGRSAIEKFDAVNSFGVPCSLELLLEFFALALLLELVDALLCLLALIEGFAFLFPDLGLVLDEGRVETLLQVEIATHLAVFLAEYTKIFVDSDERMGQVERWVA